MLRVGDLMCFLMLAVRCSLLVVRCSLFVVCCLFVGRFVFYDLCSVFGV